MTDMIFEGLEAEALSHTCLLQCLEDAVLKSRDTEQLPGQWLHEYSLYSRLVARGVCILQLREEGLEVL